MGSTPRAGADRARGSLRAIAAFETIKGITAIAAAAGLLGALRHDVRQAAAALIGHIGLSPGAHYSSIVLRVAEALRNANLRLLILVACAYALVRLVEAYGLWHDRAWGEWLGALSGALYVPFEVRHLIHRPTAADAVVIVVNVAIVAFLASHLRRSTSIDAGDVTGAPERELRAPRPRSSQ